MHITPTTLRDELTRYINEYPDCADMPVMVKIIRGKRSRSTTTLRGVGWMRSGRITKSVVHIHTSIVDDDYKLIKDNYPHRINDKESE